ncbi:MAG TPA: formate dehydrogenase accessory sulfurtransferase FdhD [Chloroflexia bacterium]|nr:formate dehydrogenase accessory sulfurtransferase FdhD [Chloroflexia bacterium]
MHGQPTLSLISPTDETESPPNSADYSAGSCRPPKPNSGTPHSALSSVRESVVRYRGNDYERTDDYLAVEEPLQIRLAGEDVAVTMRTPGHDAELAAGFLFTEGIIAGKQHIEAIAYCPLDDGSRSQNVINVLPTNRALLEPGSWGRNFISSSSCGLCGKTSIQQVSLRSKVQSPKSDSHTPLSTLRIPPGLFYALEAKLRAAQETFTQTGGLHAAALFDLDGDLIVLREDVGRHNAVDKIIGYALLQDQLPLDRHIVVVSSRASFEIIQKALTSGVQVLAAFSAPSSLAVELARQADMTLVAFLRQGRLNIYAGEERVMRET